MQIEIKIDYEGPVDQLKHFYSHARFAAKIEAHSEESTKRVITPIFRGDEYMGLHLHDYKGEEHLAYSFIRKEYLTAMANGQLEMDLEEDLEKKLEPKQLKLL